MALPVTRLFLPSAQPGLPVSRTDASDLRSSGCLTLADRTGMAHHHDSRCTQLLLPLRPERQRRTLQRAANIPGHRQMLPAAPARPSTDTSSSLASFWWPVRSSSVCSSIQQEQCCLIKQEPGAGLLSAVQGPAVTHTWTGRSVTPNRNQAQCGCSACVVCAA